MLNTGVVGGPDFNGDGGFDILQNDGAATDITFTGGADDDQFLNTASDVNSITFNGGGSLTNPIVSGDDGNDVLQNDGHNIGSLDFNGDAGNDVLPNKGDIIGVLDKSCSRTIVGVVASTGFGRAALLPEISLVCREKPQSRFVNSSP